MPLAASAAGSDDRNDALQFSFTFHTPQPKLTPASGLHYTVDLQGYPMRATRPGAPDLPRHTELIAVPPGATPRLEVRVIAERVLARRRPQPVGAAVVELDAEGYEKLGSFDADPARREQLLRSEARTVFREDPAIYGGRSTFPASVVELGQVGALRDQRFVPVHLNPVRYDPTIDALRVATAIHVTVHFDGGAPAPAPAAPERFFEPIYRERILNYEQGRFFRLSGGPPTKSPATLDAVPKGSPGSQRTRVRIQQAGVTRLDHASLVGSPVLAQPLSSWVLTSRGVTVPLQIEDTSANDLLDPGEWIQFYAQPLDDEIPVLLDVTAQDNGGATAIHRANDYSDEGIYFVSAQGGGASIASLGAAPALALTPPTHFGAIARKEIADGFRPWDDLDPWSWLPTLSLNFNSPSRLDVIPLPGLYGGTEPIDVEVGVKGISPYSIDADLAQDPDHATTVSLRNNSQVVLASDSATFDGRTIFTHQFGWTFPGSGAVASDPLEIEVEVTSIGPQPNDVMLDWIEIGYRRSFDAVNGTLTFEWPDEEAEFLVSGLTNNSVEIYEITLGAGEQIVQPVRLTGATIGSTGPYTARFHIDPDPAIPDLAPRRFVVTGSDAIIVPAAQDIETDTVSDLRLNTNQADLLVIGHPDVLDDTMGSSLDQLLAHRATASGGSLTSRVVALQDVYDEFDFGLEGPRAIREFLRYVLSNAPGEGWADPRPAFVILLGDGSYDYKAGPVRGSLVPTQMLFKADFAQAHYASDNWMAAVSGGDHLADLMIGRFPARSLPVAERIIDKIVAYETMILPGTWQEHSLFISDRGTNSGAGNLDFELTNREGESLICSDGESFLLFNNLADPEVCPGGLQRSPFTFQHLRYWTDFYQPVCDPSCSSGQRDMVIDSMRNAIKDEVNGGTFGVSDGAAVVQFSGHGNHLVWSNDAFFDNRTPGPPPQDTTDLTNTDRLTFMMAHNCLTGGFNLTTPESMGEDWLKQPGGGAVGVWSPSGLSFNSIGNTVTEIVWAELFGRRKERLIGSLVTTGLTQLCANRNVEPCQNYILLGDPATRLALRSVEPPSAPLATGGDAQVDLSWTPSVTPSVTYDVYRTANLFSAYQQVGSGIGAAAFTDTTVINAETYYYYVVAKNVGGFESPWSNFNTDCDLGPDCLAVTPLNPNKPSSPTGLSVTDPGVGDRLTVSWAANPETDIAFYTVHYGPAEGDYPNSIDAGAATTTSVTGLTQGERVFIVVTATNTSSKTSDPSAPVNDLPVFAPGVRPPDFIDDLRLSISGADVVLEWTEIDSDAYGKPLQIGKYEVFRGVSPASLGKIGECTSPCAAFSDPGAATLPQAFHYRVRAVTPDGLAGALGSQFPDGTFLDIGRAPTPGNLVLSWTPVSSVVGGGGVELSHYVVYADSLPIDLDAARAGTAPVLTTTTETTIEITPPVGDRYYSVFAVDVRGNVSPY